MRSHAPNADDARGGNSRFENQLIPGAVAAFRFSLQPLLDQRTNVEAAKRRSLLDAEHIVALEGAKLLALEAELRRLSQAFGEVGRGGPGDLRAVLLEIDLVKAAIAQQRRTADAARETASSARAAFLAARTDREALQSLRDRKYEAFLAEEERREAAAYDEANAKSGTIQP